MAKNSSAGRLFRQLFGPFKFPIPTVRKHSAPRVQRRLWVLGPIPNRNRQSLCVAAKLAAEHLLERNLKTQRGYR